MHIDHKIDQNVKTYNLDARDFITQIARENHPITQIVMNLPVSAELFTDVFTTCFTVCALLSLKISPIRMNYQPSTVTCSVVRKTQSKIPSK